LIEGLALLIGLGGNLVEFSTDGVDRLLYVFFGCASAGQQCTGQYKGYRK
jgi:hypothetical protein